MKTTSKAENDSSSAEVATSASLRGLTGGSSKRSAWQIQIKEILVPVDFSPASRHAFRYALAFAAQHQARVTLLHVVDMDHPVTRLAVNIKQVTANLRQQAERHLEAFIKNDAPADVPLRKLVVVGKPFHEITRAAERGQVNLIIMSTHGRTGLPHVLLGSAAERVVRYAPCPVLTVHDPEREFVVPTDLKPFENDAKENRSRRK